ncbi:MAG: mechanosensitive ion channel, partial [Anaerolineae bacterium]|nr:mechanosensitive ion channel [Anaerolineae bacterium]
MQQFVTQLWQTLGAYVPNLIGALGILIIGWLAALAISWAIKQLLERTSVDDRIAASLGLGKGQSDVDIETLVSKTIYYLLMVIVLVMVFDALELTIVTVPLTAMLGQFTVAIPQILYAIVLGVVAWLVASGARLLVSRVFSSFGFDERLSSQAGISTEGQAPISETLANVLYWFILLLFLPAILGALNMQGLLEPVTGMVNTLLGFLPNILAAAIIIFIGWIVARIVRQVVTGLLTAANADAFGDRIGLNSTTGQSLTNIVGTIVFAFIIIPVIISGLNALKIEAISRPATDMLQSFFNAVPNIFGALVILAVTYFVARLVANIISSLLAGVGFDRILSLIGIGGDPQEGQATPSQVVGYLVIIYLMLFAAIEAGNILGFDFFSSLISQLLALSFQVLVGIVILGLGLYLANLAHRVISDADVRAYYDRTYKKTRVRARHIALPFDVAGAPSE